MRKDIMRIKFILLIILVPVLLCGQTKNMRIALMDLEPGSGVNKALGRDTADLIRAEMINLNLFTVLERAQMNAILKEQGFQMSGCTDTECAVEMGRLLSANKMMIGKISKFGQVTTINVRMFCISK